MTEYTTVTRARKNSGESDVGTRRRFNFIEGSGVTLTIADDATDGEIDVQIAASGEGSGDVTAAANLTDDRIVRGAGGAKGVQTTNVAINDSDDISGVHNLSCNNQFYFATGIQGGDSLASIDTWTDDDSVILIRAKDTNVGQAEVGRLQGAADPYFSMGGSQEFKFYNGGTANFAGNVAVVANITIDGRDLSVDGAKLDGIATAATKYPDTGEQAFLDADHTKLDTIDESADATPAASPTVAGKVELATTAEINTGDDTTRAMGVKAFADSDFGIKTLMYRCVAMDVALTADDDLGRIPIPGACNGMDLIGCYAHVDVASTDGLPSFGLYNLNDSVEILTTNVTIDENEFSSHTANTAPVINTGCDDVNSGERIRVDCGVAGTGTNGLVMELKYRLP